MTPKRRKQASYGTLLMAAGVVALAIVVGLAALGKSGRPPAGGPPGKAADPAKPGQVGAAVDLTDPVSAGRAFITSYSGKQFTAPLLGVEYSDGKTRARVAFDNATETEVWLVYDRLRKRWKGQKYRYRIKGAGYVTIPPEY